MITREPKWRIKNEQDWGFTPLRNSDFIKEYLSFPKHLLFLYNCQRQSKKIVKCFEQFDKRRISLGSGSEVPNGWVGFDIKKHGDCVFPVNLLLGIPLEDNSVDEILAEHIIEHFFLDDVYNLIAECYRVLVPGGKIRIICPDAKNIAELLLKGQEADKDHDVLTDSKIHRWPDDGMRWARFINRLSHQWGQHKCILSRDMLESILNKTGFDEIFQVTDRDSKLFDVLPDIHRKRFPDDGPNLNLAIEGLKKK